MRTSPNCVSRIEASDAGSVSSASLFNASNSPTSTEDTRDETLQASLSASSLRSISAIAGSEFTSIWSAPGELLGLGPPLRQRMAVPRQRDELVVEQLEHADVGRLSRGTLRCRSRNGTVRGAARRYCPPRCDGIQSTRTFGRLRPQALAQRLEQHELAGFARGHREIAHGMRRDRTACSAAAGSPCRRG